MADSALRLAQAASQHMAAGDYLSAAQKFLSATLAAPMNSGHFSGLGDAYGAIGKVSDAEAAYHRAIQINPRNGKAYLGVGELALTTRQQPRGAAVRWLEHSVALLPRTASAWLLLGAAQNEDAYEHAADREALLDESVSSLRTATRLAPSDAMAYWQLGDVLTARGERRLGVQSLAAAVRLRPDFVEAYSSLARVLSYEALSPLARRLAAWAFRKALAAAPDHLETWHNLGEYLHANGEPTGAAVALGRATSIAPSSGPSYLTLGESMQRMCMLNDASRHYARAAALLPRSARAQIHALLSTSLASTYSHAPPPSAIGAGGEVVASAGAPNGKGHPSQRVLPSPSALRVSATRPQAEWQSAAIRALNEHGVVVVEGFVPTATCEALRLQIAAWPAEAEGTSATTRQPHRRRHQALPMFANASGEAVRALSDGLGGVLRDALGTPQPRVVECGYLCSDPGAQAQALHADTAPASMRACEAPALKIQLALIDVDATMGPLEVVPGTHEDRANSPPLRQTAASEAVTRPSYSDEPPLLALPILVRPGDVTVYWSSLMHRGGANTAARSRPTFHIAAIGEGGAPTGMPYTVLVDDILAVHAPSPTPK